MSAFKPITIYRPRKNVIAKFRSTDGINLPNQTVLFADLSLFREYARRKSADTLGKFNYDIAEYAVDNELPKPSYNNKEIRFHNSLREGLLKKRQEFIESRKVKSKDVQASINKNSVETIKDCFPELWEFIKVEVQNENTLGSYKTQINHTLSLEIPVNNIMKKFGDLYLEEIEYEIGGSGFKIISALRGKVSKGLVKETTLINYQRFAKLIFKFLKQSKLIDTEPLFPKVGRPDPISIPFTKEELKTFECYARDLYENGGEKNFLRGFYIARFTGARVHEIANLQVKHWYKDSAEHSHFKLPKAKGFKKAEKGGTVGTLFASNDILIDFLEKDFAGRDPEEYILCKPNGSPWYTAISNYTTRFGKALKELGIIGKQPWHAFRHTGAIELFEITGDIYQVKTFLRHKLLLTTQRYLNLSRVNHVVEKSQNCLGKETVRTLRNENPQLEGGRKLIEINPIREVA